MTSVFLQLAKKVLENEHHALTVPEIWNRAVEKGYDKETASSGKTPIASLGAMLYVDVRDNPKSLFVSDGVRPKRFVLKADSNNLGEQVFDQEPQITPSQKPGYLEKELHPFMAYFVYYKLRSYPKSILHNKSSKKEYGEWVHPDMVGCYFPYNDWQKEVVNVSTLMGTPSIKFFSFELKRELTFGNIRESFFQAVSNSSWANEGYLAAAEIDMDVEFQTELKRLSSSFGIGIIKIDIKDPDATEVLMPAMAKDRVDWETINKLAGINSDFREFLNRVKSDMSSQEVRREQYDKVFEKADLISRIH
jgi:uncharacterized protein